MPLFSCKRVELVMIQHTNRSVGSFMVPYGMTLRGEDTLKLIVIGDNGCFGEMSVIPDNWRGLIGWEPAFLSTWNNEYL